MSIMYGCDRCASVDPERCAYNKRSELRVVGDQWLCDLCFDFREPMDDKCWNDYQMPERYISPDALHKIANLPDDANIHEAWLIALRGLRDDD